MNTLTKLLEEFPDKPWDMHFVSANPNFTLEYIDSHPELSWDFRGDDWDEGVSGNPNLTLDYVINNKDKNWSWQEISKNPGITLQDIENNLSLSWNWACITSNPNITMDFILKYKDKFQRDNDNEFDLGSTKNITLENIKQYPDLFWSESDIAKNPNMTLDFALDNIKDIWQYCKVAKSPMVTFQDIENYKNSSWHGTLISGFSGNPNMTLDIFNNHREYPWDIVAIIRNPSFTINDLEYFDDGADVHFYRNMSSNPNITFDWIVENQNKQLNWGCDGLSSNKFLCHEYFEEEIIIRI